MEIKIRKDIPFAKVDSVERIVGGIVYSTGTTPDADGDFVDSASELWSAMKSWILKSGGRMKLMHKGLSVATPVVECFLAETKTTKNGADLSPGDWYISVFIPKSEEALWQSVQNHEITGFSLAGTAVGELVDDDETDVDKAVEDVLGALNTTLSLVSSRVSFVASADQQRCDRCYPF